MSSSGIQNAHTAAYRALCLGALLTRGGLETAVKPLYDRDRDIPDGVRRFITSRHWQEHHRLNQWIREERLEPYLSRAERLLLSKSFPSWTERNLTVAAWRSESLGVILWALRAIDTLPAFDTPFQAPDVLTPLEIFTPTIDFVWQASLRPAARLQHLRDTADLWNWRARAAELERMGIKPPEGLSFAGIIRLTAEKGHENGLLPAPIDGDFPAFGRAYARMSHAQAVSVSHIAHQRCAALNWLCELSSEWESLPVDNV
ncbi:MAG: DUF4272 domain-containing protein [Anaerolineae bacterium]|jgi:hypothetical protein|nr:DUF4272 domain-containing protein [Anaerolineae bacterium]